MRVSRSVRRAQLLDREREGRLQLLLGSLVEFGAPNGEIKDIDGDLPFGIDQGHLDIAIVRGQRGGDLAQQPGPVLSDHLQQGAVGRRGVIEIKPSCYLDHDGSTDGLAAAQQHFDRRLERDDVQQALAEAIHLRRIELQGAEGIGKLKGVDDDSGIVGKRLGFDNVHAPGGECAGHVGKEQRPIAW